MIERTYGPPGGTSHRGITGSGIAWARAAQAPNDQPQPDAHVPTEAFDTVAAEDWLPIPDLQNSDPHDEPFTAEVGTGPPAVAAVPTNIVGSGDVGSVAADFDGGYDSAEVPENVVLGDQ